MTSVPKPLKFLSKHYAGLKVLYNSLPSSNFKVSIDDNVIQDVNQIFLVQSDFADLVSVIGMVASDEGSNESLIYCLEGTKRNLIDWGHEYLRQIAGEIGQLYNKRVEAQTEFDDLMFLVDIIIPYFMKNHEEPEAVDLLMEVESLERVLNFTNDSNFERVCNYLLSCA